MRRSVGLGLLVMVVATGVAAAKAPKGGAERPAQLQRLIDCRAVGDSAARLACFDKEAAAMDEATRRQELVVVDRAQVRSTRRSLFGFAVPDLGVLGGSDKDEVKAVEGVIASVRTNGDGGWIFALQGGAVWSQIDGRPIALPPGPGDKVLVKKAAMGSYMLSVERQPSVRVRRIG